MKDLKIHIIENLVLNKHIKNQYNPDHLNNDKIVLFNNDGEDEEILWDDCINKLDTIEKNYDCFIVCRFNPLTKIKDFNDDLIDYGSDLERIRKSIITGKDYGYEIRLSYGHLEIDCINSGSRSTYYIYALNPDCEEKIEDWFDTPESLDGDDDITKLDFLFEKGNILEIKLD